MFCFCFVQFFTSLSAWRPFRYLKTSNSSFFSWSQVFRSAAGVVGTGGFLFQSQRGELNLGILKAWGTIFTVNPIYCLSHSEENLYCEFSLLRRREGGAIHIYMYNYSNELARIKTGVGGGTQTRSMQG